MKPYSSGRALEHREVVVADLVAQAARARVDQDGDLPFAQAHDLGRGLVEHAVNDLDLEEVVARAERAALVVPALMARSLTRSGSAPSSRPRASV